MHFANKTEIYKKAISVWGFESQLLMAIEEMAELTEAISHLLRNRKNSVNEMLEELADVEIMIEQMRIVFTAKKEAIDKIKEEKLIRLSKILEGNNGE